MTLDKDLAIRTLLDQFGPIAVLTGDDVRQRPVSKQIASGCEAAALLRPSSTQELADMVRICARHHLPVVPRSGMTGLVGGTVAGPNEAALSLERMTGIVSVDPTTQTMIVKAGTPLQLVQEAAEAHGLQFPLDLGARGTATIGGMLSTNAGGNKVLRYGMTRDLVLGLEAVLPNGDILDSMFSLLKNNTGLDVKHLFIGTEGTLGIITQAVLRLYPGTTSRQTALCAFESFDALVATLREVRQQAGPALTSFEAMWQDYFQLLTQPGRLRAPLPDHYPLYALIECEYNGNDAAGDANRYAGMLESVMEAGHVADAVLAQSETERAALWCIRDEVHYLRTMDPFFSFDISLPTAHMPAYLDTVRQTLAARWPQLRFICYGHIGDGNLHLGISCGTAADADTVSRHVYAPLSAIGGSVSAEHGIGLYKKPYLELTRNPVEREVMRRVKEALDPAHLLNPGKIL